ncbi:MAG: redoxin domain-containing protein [Pyrinomonadaceae bacterium]
MKRYFASLLLFALFGFALSGCSSDAGSKNFPSDSVNTETVNKTNTETKPKESGYPLLSEKVAQATLSHLDGSTSTVADLKGKVVLLNMWATWCGPCRSEMPTLVRLQEEIGQDDLEIIGLNVDDESVELIKPFAEEMKLNYTLVWPTPATQGDLMKISKFSGIPQSFIIDRDGYLRGVFRGANPADVRKMDKLVRAIVAE